MFMGPQWATWVSCTWLTLPLIFTQGTTRCTLTKLLPVESIALMLRTMEVKIIQILGRTRSSWKGFWRVTSLSKGPLPDFRSISPLRLWMPPFSALRFRLMKLQQSSPSGTIGSDMIRRPYRKETQQAYSGTPSTMSWVMVSVPRTWRT